MKKAIPGIIVLVALTAAVAFFYLKKADGQRTRATALAPAETIFFAHFPDLARTAKRWPETGVAKIIAEPEMQAFLAKPRASAPWMKFWEEKFAQIRRVEPGEAFVAVTSIDGPQPRFVAGFSFAGNATDVKTLLAEPRAHLHRTWPAGKSDLTMQGQTEIETFSYSDQTVGEALAGAWYLVSNDLELLRRTIDAVPNGLGEKALAADDLFEQAMTKLPTEGESSIFVRTSLLSERLVSLLVASGQALEPKQIAEIKKVQALAWGTKFEEDKVRDTLFLLSPETPAEAPLARTTLALSSPQTLLTYASAIPATFEMSKASAAYSTLIPGFAALETRLAERGLKLTDFGKAFGPEFGTLVNWAEGAGQPSPIMALEVRDAAMAKEFAEVVTSGLPGSLPWGRQEIDGVTIYQSPGTGGLVPLAPCAALTPRFLILGLTQADVTAALERLKTGQSAIADTPAYDQATKEVEAPTAGFAYLDLKSFFDRTYGMLRPFLAMSLAFSPDAGKYIDAGKLPQAETISKHLGTSVYSQSVTAEGTLIESVGTLTFNQLLIGTVGGATAAAFPMLENALAGGLSLDPTKLLNPAAPVAPSASPDASVLPADPATPPPAPTPADPEAAQL